MVRTQIYLTEQEQKQLRVLASQMGKTQSELIRQAVDRFVESFAEDSRRQALMAACGIWKDREDLPDFQALRKEWNRFPVDGDE